MKPHLLLVAASLLAATVAGAQPKHVHADAKRGGGAEEAGAHHLELVIIGKTITLYVDDHAGKAQDVSKMKARASIFSGKDKGTVELAPDGAGALKGEAAFPVAADAKFLVSLTPAGGKTAQARFQLGAKVEHKGHKH